MFNNLYKVSYADKISLYSKIFTVISGIVISILVISLIQIFLFFPVYQKSSGMSPDIPEKSAVLVSKIFDEPKRGDVYLVAPIEKEQFSVFQKVLDFFQRFFTAQKVSFLTSKSENYPCLRRVVGLPGDTIYINNYVVYIKNNENPQFLTEFELTNSSYNLELLAVTPGIDGNLGVMENMEAITLGKDEYFFLSDARHECIDSRIWGTVKKNSILGKAVFVYFPFNKINFL